MKTTLEKKDQIEKFKEAAREFETDDSESLCPLPETGSRHAFEAEGRNVEKA
jgi:hypothetical protein